MRVRALTGREPEMVYHTQEELKAAFPAHYAREEAEMHAPINQYRDGWEG